MEKETAIGVTNKDEKNLGEDVQIDVLDNSKVKEPQKPLKVDVNGENKKEENKIESHNKETHLWWGLPANLIAELVGPLLGVFGGCGALAAICWLFDKDFKIKGISKNAENIKNDIINSTNSLSLGKKLPETTNENKTSLQLGSSCFSEQDKKSLKDVGKDFVKYLSNRRIIASTEEEELESEGKNTEKLIKEIFYKIRKGEIPKEVIEDFYKEEKPKCTPELLESFLKNQVKIGESDNPCTCVSSTKETEITLKH